MSTIGALIYFAGVIWASYKLGNQGAGYGFALFIAASIFFVVVTRGPEALFRGEDGCTRYSYFADDC
ncbi:hypothetical protein [Sinorhizobium fredii]|uniref:hypothetical protein n=1 Tax=Rhizobium fredii TaxID=380 RepID=UPI0004B4CBE7|nr:hypothetical protein [Sinorhizobium fredii]AWI57046.1 hypothetical protein AB395_00001380 [Sinorhizobium fredii CCBAU 45436]